MDCHDLVDWLSFTVPINHELGNNSYDLAGAGNRALGSFMGSLWDDIVIASDCAEWERRAGRSPYQASWHNGHGLTFYVGVGSKNVLVEISGRGCEWLRKNSLQHRVIENVHERVSRVDVATDINTSVLPSEFVGAGYSKSFKSVGMVSSESGETCYIGSKKSERFCRVYRYNKPHPRSDYLRIEYVYRKKAAKSIAAKLALFSVASVADSSSSLYKWEHKLMAEKKGNLDMKIYRPERPSGKTLRWIISQVAPAFRKLVKEGVIDDPEQFLFDHFIKKEEK